MMSSSLSVAARIACAQSTSRVHAFIDVNLPHMILSFNPSGLRSLLSARKLTPARLQALLRSYAAATHPPRQRADARAGRTDLSCSCRLRECVEGAKVRLGDRGKDWLALMPGYHTAQAKRVVRRGHG